MPHGHEKWTCQATGGTGKFAHSRGQWTLHIEEPVSEITIAGNVADMFLRLVPASDLVYRFSVNAPTVAIEGLTIAGT